jgi:hypothetical protein
MTLLAPVSINTPLSMPSKRSSDTFQVQSNTPFFIFMAFFFMLVVIGIVLVLKFTPKEILATWGLFSEDQKK